MAKNTIPRGETSVVRHIFIQDSTSTAGAGKTGLAYNTASLVAYYLYPGGTATSLTLETISTLGTYAAPTSAAHMRFKEVDATNMPGIYEVQFHDDWFSVANARKGGIVQMKGATGMAPVQFEFDVIGFALQSATPAVDVTAISGDATAADNLEKATDGTGYNLGGGDITVSSVGTVLALDGDAIAAVADGVWDEALAGHTTAGTGGKVLADAAKESTAQGILDHTGTTGVKIDSTAQSGLVTAIWGALTSALTGVGSIGKYLLDHIVGTIATGTHTAQTGDAYARLGEPAGASVSADIAAVKAETATIVADTAELQGDWANGGRLDVILDARAATTHVQEVEDKVDLLDVTTTATSGKIDLVKAKTDNLPALPAAEGSQMNLVENAITATNVGIGAFQADAFDTDAISAAAVSAAAVTKLQNGLATGANLALVKAILDKLETGIELDGAVYRWTANALENAPGAGSAPTVQEIWEAILASYSGVSGSAAEALATAGSGGIPPATQTQIDTIEAAVASMTGGTVTYTSPVVIGTSINIARGYDYLATDSRQIALSSSDWPVLTGATVELVERDAARTLVHAMSIVLSGAGTQTVQLELTDTETAAIDPGVYLYRVSATLAGGSVVDLCEVRMTVR